MKDKLENIEKDSKAELELVNNELENHKQQKDSESNETQNVQNDFSDLQLKVKQIESQLGVSNISDVPRVVDELKDLLSNNEKSYHQYKNYLKCKKKKMF